MIEKWELIKDFENYSISNFGNVRSPTRILKQPIDEYGYPIVCLYQNNIQKTKRVHRLVWDAFGNKPRNGHSIQIDHIDNNKTNNHINNLHLMTNRQNVSKYYKTIKTASKYTGVFWSKASNKWYARITINKKLKHIGYFISEIDAHNTYQKELESLNESK